MTLVKIINKINSLIEASKTPGLSSSDPPWAWLWGWVRNLFKLLVFYTAHKYNFLYFEIEWYVTKQLGQLDLIHLTFKL